MGEDELILNVPIPTRGFLAGVTLPILAIEVTQAIQDLQNSVTLIAGKATFVRVYLEQGPIGSTSPFVVPIPITGELAWRRGDGAQGMVSATVNLRPADPPALATQRESVGLSLNFRLPAEAITAGSLTLRLHSLFEASSGHVPFTGTSSVTVEFKETPPLIVRVIGFRYMGSTGEFVEPDAIHFAYLRSYLERAYPVARVEWSQIVIAADFAPPFIDSDGPGPMTAITVNAQLAALRTSEENLQTAFDAADGSLIPFNARTHYYGLVGDNGNRDFMQGMAAIAPVQPRPDTVACGPAGALSPRFPWDTDASFADWYGAHELGHTFGRNHPGDADPAFPYRDGQIGDDANDYIGFDVGDETLNLPMQALPGKIHHDVMTHKDRLWLSDYTYEAIWERLIEEAQIIMVD